MTQINAYLTFDGNCREAMTFYKECLGGELVMMPFEGSPMADKVPAEARNRIMHANLVNGQLMLMASDAGMQDKVVNGNNVALSLNCSSDEEINTFFQKLSAGGKVTLPLGQQFWGATFGMLTDRFGTNWMLNYDKNPKK